MAYKFSVGDVVLSGSLTAKQGRLYSSGSVGDIALRDNAGMRRYDVDYNSGAVRLRLRNSSGAVKASIAESGLISGSGDLKAAGALIVGGQQYGINSNGAVTGSSASLTSLSVGDGNITNVGDIALDSISADGSSFSFGSNWTAAGRTCANLGTVTTADIDGGSIDGTAIGAASQSTIKATTISGSSTLEVGGNLTTAGNVKFLGSADASIDVNVDSLYFRDGDGLMKRDTVADIIDAAAGTVTTTGLAGASNGTMGIAIHSLNAEVIATGDFIAFSDAGDNGLHKESVDDLFTNGLPLVTEAAMTVADDYIVFLDGGATGAGKKEKWADLVSLMAGGGLTATNGQLSVQSNSSTQASCGTALSEGYNYTTGSAGGTFLLPVNATVGDVVTLKIGASDGGKVTVARQAIHTIDATLTSLSLDSAHAAVTLVYMVSGSWKIV